MYNDDGNDISIGRDGKGDRDNSLKFIIVAILQLYCNEKSVVLGKYSNSIVKKENVQGGNKAFEESKVKDVDMSDVDDMKEGKNKNIN